MKILVKYPTRERPTQFLKVLAKTIQLQSTKDVTYLVSYDEDDYTFNDELIALIKKRFHQVVLVGGRSSGKIHACNRDVVSYNGEWDIVLLLSDDMIPQKKGWDAQLIKEMEEHYPDTDGVLWHNDGYVGKRLNTMCILGRKYFERFGYIYHPAYVSLWCDNEFMDVANKLGKQTYFEEVLFKHDHPMNMGSMETYDPLYRKNDKHFHKDKMTYELRKRQNFALNSDTYVG